MIIFLSQVGQGGYDVGVGTFRFVGLHAVPKYRLAVVHVQFALPVPIVRVADVVGYAILYFCGGDGSAVNERRHASLYTIVGDVAFVVVDDYSLRAYQVLSFISVLHRGHLVVRPRVFGSLGGLQVGVVLVGVATGSGCFLIFIGL